VELGQPQKVNYEVYYDSLVRDAQLIYILSRHFPERLKNVTGDQLSAIIDPIGKGNYNTLSSAYSILALDAYGDAVGPLKAGELMIDEVLADNKRRSLILPTGNFPTVLFSEEAEKLRFENKSGQVMFYQTMESGFDRALPDKEIKEGLEVQREYRNEAGEVVNSVPLGTQLSVHLKVRAIGGKEAVPNVALVDLLPGGFEVVLDSIRSGVGAQQEAQFWWPQYVDVREDRVIVFGGVGAEVTEFTYKVRATNRGQFLVPPAFGESMYDRSIQARSLGGQLAVTEAK